MMPVYIPRAAHITDQYVPLTFRLLPSMLEFRILETRVTSFTHPDKIHKCIARLSK